MPGYTPRQCKGGEELTRQEPCCYCQLVDYTALTVSKCNGKAYNPGFVGCQIRHRLWVHRVVPAQFSANSGTGRVPLPGPHPARPERR